MIGGINIENKKEQEIYVNSEKISCQIAEMLDKNKEQEIDKNLVYQITLACVENKEIAEEVYKEVLNLLESKYNVTTYDDPNFYEIDSKEVEI